MYQEFFSKDTQLSLFLQVGIRGTRVNGHRNLIINTVNYTEPASEAAVISIIKSREELRNFDQRERQLLVEYIVILILELNTMPIIAGFRERAKHLETNQVKLAEGLRFAMEQSARHMLRNIEHQTFRIRFVTLELNLNDNPVTEGRFCHQIRHRILAERCHNCRIHHNQVPNTVGPIQLEDGIQKTSRNTTVFRIAHNILEYAIVIEVDVLITILETFYTGMNVATSITNGLDFLEHF